MSGESRRPRRIRTGIVTVLVAALAPLSIATPRIAHAAPVVSVSEAREIRSLPTAEFGLRHPDSIAHASDGTFLVGETRGNAANIVQVTPSEDVVGLLRVPDVAPGTLAFDPRRNRLTGLGSAGLRTVEGRAVRSGQPPSRTTDVDRARLKDPQGSTYDPATGTWFVLDRGSGDIAKIVLDENGAKTVSRITPRGIDGRRLQGIAFNASDALLYVVDPAEQRLYGLDGAGEVEAAIDLRSLELVDPRAIVFAPTPDKTDAPAATDLFIADSGDSASLGRVVEASVAPATVSALAAPTTVAGSLVRTIHTSQFNPPSPDPAGITYLPAADRLEFGDSEVEEMPPYWQGVNLWQTTRTGQVTDTGTTSPTFSKEPTGLGYQASTNTLCVSDDNLNRIFLVRPGADGRFGNADDQRSFINTLSFGSNDAEDCDFNSSTGHLLVTDGENREVYTINPVNGIFGDGNDLVTQFDLQQYGVQDPEGIAYDASRNLIVVADRAGKRLYDLTTDGVHLRTITMAAATPKNPADVTVAPSTNNPALMSYYVVDRMVDNGVDPNENDGKAYEVSAPTGDTPPTVAITNPASGSTVAGTLSITATAGDDNGVSQVQFLVDGSAIGTDTNGGNGWSASWNSAGVADGSHSLVAIATDTIGQTGSTTIGVTVDNVDSPPTVSITGPASGATVSGTINVQASANDDRGVSQVQFFVDGTSIGVDANAANGWGVSWDTNGVSDGSHALTAAARDTANQTATSAAVSVSVLNSGSPGVLDVAIATNFDDVEERENGRIWNNSDLDLVTDTNPDNVEKVGLRYLLAGIPQGSTITNAYVQFQVDKVDSEPTSLTVQANATDNAAAFNLTKFEVSSRPRTVASVTWSPAPWTRVGDRTPAQRTPNIAAVLQEVVDRGGWSSGNALVLIITGTGRRTAESFDGDFAPVLHVEYATG
jgi:uncharacterized protein YjiK